MHDYSNYANFSEAAAAVMRQLHERTGLDLWMITRTEGNDWIVLDAHDHGYGIAPGTVLSWSDSFCSRMVRGEGPRAAHRADEIPAYAAAPIGKQYRIGAYLGAPLSRADGSLFGTLCGVHPAARGPDLHDELPLVELLAKLLSSLLMMELQATHLVRRAERAEAELLTDSLTGLYNRRGWDALLAAEESRCKRYGNPACVISIDLDELKETNDQHGHAFGDGLLRRTADVMRASTRQQDLLARVGGDEFAVLAVECDEAGGESLVERLLEAFSNASVRASVGMAPRMTTSTLEAAWRVSDERMYAEKRRQQAVAMTNDEARMTNE
jgi:diguanylate cyclase (GGDEF)-like protein